MNTKARGFTLLELLIAITIFALISSAAYALLNSVRKAHDASSLVLQQMDKEQRVEIVLERDLGQIISDVTLTNNGRTLSFVRNGWPNLLTPERSTLQRVRYQLDDDALVRQFWPVTASPDEEPPVEQVLMIELSGLSLRVKNSEGQWLNQWPPSEKGKTNPIGLELTLEHQRLGTMLTVTALPDYAPKPTKPPEGKP